MSSIDKQDNTNGYWRSLDELADAPRFRAILEAEFPAEADPGGINRRRWLQLMGASLALAGMSGCWKEQEIRPFAQRPDGRTPGKPVRIATAMPLGESATGLLVTNVDGRPIKVEGNPRATDVLAQATILDLYDPDRSRQPLRNNGKDATPETWEAFQSMCRSHFGSMQAAQGEGFCVLAEGDSSPTVDRLRKELPAAFPKAQWFDYDPINDDNERAGAQLAFQRPVRTHYRLFLADVILCLDCDLLASHPAAIRYASDFAAKRIGTRMTEDGISPTMNRLYAVESSFSVTGAAADHRLPLASGQIPGFLGMLERDLAGAAESAQPSKKPTGHIGQFVRAVAEDLWEQHRGKSVVAVGPGQPPEAHAAVHRINALLENVGKTVHYTQVPRPDRPAHVDAIRELSDQMRAGRVKTLLILGGNPIYNAPADLEFAEALKKVDTTIHLSLYRNETSHECSWHVPQAHFLEAWGDVRSYDGAYSVIQPMIAPLFGGRSSIEVLATVLDSVATDTAPADRANRADVSAQQQVRKTFGNIKRSPIASWTRTLRDGRASGSAWLDIASLPAPAGSEVPQNVSEKAPKNGQLEVVFCRDASVYDGRFANNSWLQEWPDPITKLTWDNAALIGPSDAKRLGVDHEEVVELKIGQKSLELPAYVMPGQAAGTISVRLGYGRTRAGRVAGSKSAGVKPVGVDVYPLRMSDAMSIAEGASIKPTGRKYRLACTQDHHAIDAIGQKGRDERVGTLVKDRDQRVGPLIREATLEHYRKHPDFAQHAVHHPPLKSLWKDREFTGHRWGMVIDLSKCIGCGACVIACQAENNVPVVGKDQVLLGREMHWLRVDRYFQGDVDDPRVANQPLPCQQCELAPCEQVCPVAATTHSSEGLNDMVYNRCIGTRYCANNCPYKVRRFNYFNLHKDLDQPDNEVAKMKYNPEVTVRSRGVMEKCTYCVQRIQAAKIEAKQGDRTIKDGRIQTACQQACPSGAIEFGDLSDDISKISMLHVSKRDRVYTILSELNIRPRTAYVARLTNLNPKIKPAGKEHGNHTG